MRISTIMTCEVEVASPGDTLRSAAQLMADLDVGALPVTDDGQLVGMITDRAIVIRGVARGRAPERCTVGGIMSTERRYCLEDDTAKAVAERMGALQVRRLPVLDRNKRLVGIVALGDLATLGADKEARRRRGGRSPRRPGSRHRRRRRAPSRAPPAVRTAVAEAVSGRRATSRPTKPPVA